MKPLNYFILVCSVLLIVFFTATSCKKKNTTTTTTPAPTGTTTSYTFNAMGITATGVQYTITNPTAGPLKIVGNNGNGTGGNYQTVTITINSAVNSTGSYTLSAAYNNSGVYTSGTNTMRYSTGSAPYVGTLNVTKIDMTNKIMSATFNFNALEYFPNNNGSGNIYGSFDNVGFN